MAFESIDTTIFDLMLNPRTFSDTQRVFVKGHAASGSPDAAEEELVVKKTDVLALLKRSKEPLSPPQIAEMLGATRNKVSSTIYVLKREKKVWCVKQISKTKYWVAA